MNRSIKIKVLKENKNKVTIKLMSLNRNMIVPKDKFIERMKSGEYDEVGDYELEESPTN